VLRFLRPMRSPLTARCRSHVRESLRARAGALKRVEPFRIFFRCTDTLRLSNAYKGCPIVPLHIFSVFQRFPFTLLLFPMDISTCPRCGDSVYPIRPVCRRHPVCLRIEYPSEERLEAAAQLVIKKGWSIKRAAAEYRIMKEDLRKHVDWTYSD
jgi:hypothetical protein